MSKYLKQEAGVTAHKLRAMAAFPEVLGLFSASSEWLPGAPVSESEDTAYLEVLELYIKEK